MGRIGMIALVLAGLIGCARAPQPVFVRFDTGEDAPRDPAEYVEVGIAVERLKADADLHAVVVGHTDAQGSPTRNKELSLRRARKLRDLILGKDIASSRIQVAARGESQPMASNDTATGRAKNRRTEIFFYYPSKGDAQAQYGVKIDIHVE